MFSFLSYIIILSSALNQRIEIAPQAHDRVRARDPYNLGFHRAMRVPSVLGAAREGDHGSLMKPSRNILKIETRKHAIWCILLMMNY